jgi:hypothetical protein
MSAMEERPPRPPRPDKGRHSAPGRAVRAALEQFRELTLQEPERVTGLRRVEDGWSVLVDVLELERVPSTTSVLATYRVDVDEDGNLLGYERLRRFIRGATDSS